MNPICPYPGLRPFTEEESIFFKGRDLHIEQVTKQLEQKKFVMLTGASGDGKSSLIYAGVIPNARAGFFKAKYNNWLFATFRPERTPLENFAKTVSQQMNLNYDEVRKELGFGFSSLVNLYKKSSFYFTADSASNAISDSDIEELKKKKRKAANLFILIDQFEEFFTNPENYTHGKASKDSQTVVNLLLETAKIALAENLPIYIICTMRSDYIGQCAAFRGLPEMIGFSQFFVPRLKRKEIHQVIEEPAILSGSKISPRLVEVLTNELNDGFDQLPVLQHVLNGLWYLANSVKDSKNREMDLVHLAMLCGMSPDYLSEDDKKLFNAFYEKRPELKSYFKNPSLAQSLSMNADLLYELSYDYFHFKTENNIEANYSALKNPENKTKEIHTKEKIQFIVKKTFQCLTQIDDARAVRHRMNLQEITDIINEPEIDCETVCRTINFYREQGATFIHPFISNEKPETRNLKPETVLDITHESLIRNWERLREWANEEHESHQILLDFTKQLQRWKNNNKSADFLLPAGTLSYFEEWYNKQKPNKYLDCTIRPL